MANKILFDNGYLFVKSYKNDTFHIHSSFSEIRKIDCQRLEQVPEKD